MVKIGFIGCHEISWHNLKKICDLSELYDDKISIVFNLDIKNCKKPSAYTDFNMLQEQYGFPLHYVSDVSNEKNIKKLQQAKLDVLFIIGWHRIVSQSVLDTAKIKLGFHSSILPFNRGSSPMNWQIINGDKIGGITLFHLTSGVDAGDIVAIQKFPILKKDDIKSLYQKATFSSLSLLEKNWKSIHVMSVKSIIQDEKLATINPRRKPSDGLIDWNKSSFENYNWIRALTKPYPGAFTFWNKKKIFIWSSRISSKKSKTPGLILDTNKKIIVSNGTGSIELLELQVENEPLCSPEVFCKSYFLKKGDKFSSLEVP